MNLQNSNEIKTHLITAFASNSQQLRKKSEQALNEYEMNDPSFILALFNLLATEKRQDTLYLQIVILIKNIINRNWERSIVINKKREGIQNLFYQNEDFINNQIKEAVLNQLILLLKQDQDHKIIIEINLTLKIISESTIPTSIQLYISENLQILTQNIANQNLLALFQTQNQGFIRTLKCVLKPQGKIKSPKYKKNQCEFILQIWQPLIQIWTALNQLQIQHLSTPEIDDLKHFDRIIGIAFFCAHPENDIVYLGQIFTQLLLKVQSLVPIQSHTQTFNLIDKNLKTLINSLSNIQWVFPASLAYKMDQHQNLYYYLYMLKNMLKLTYQRTLKASILAYIKILRCYLYNPINQQQSKFQSVAVELQQIIHTYFQNEMSYLLEWLSTNLDSTDHQEDSEELLEQEEFDLGEDVKQELQCPMYTLQLFFCESLFTRFPEFSFSQFQMILTHLANLNFQFQTEQLVDNVFSILSLLPKVAKKLNIPKDQFKQIIDIVSVLKFLNSSNNKSRKRRFSILANRYLEYFSSNELSSIGELMIKQLSSKDEVIRYLSLLFIQQLINDNFQLPMDLLMNQVSPGIVKFLEEFQKPNIIWPLLQLLIKLIEKTQQINFAINSLSMLVKSQNQLVVNAMTDTIKQIIVCFPKQYPLPEIYVLGLELVIQNLRNPSALKLLAFILNECDPLTLQNQLKQVFELLKNILITTNETTLIPVCMYLIEEFILLQYYNTSEFPNLISKLEEKILISNGLEDEEQKVQIKNSCLNIVSTMILIFLNMQQPEKLGLFQQIMQTILSDFLNLPGKLSKISSQNYYRTQLVGLLDRFIIQNAEGFFQWLQGSFLSLILFVGYQIPVENYIQMWLVNMHLITSRNIRRLNVLAVLLSIKYFPKAMVLQNLQLILTLCFEEIRNQGQGQNIVQSNKDDKNQRLSEYRQSDRKSTLRSTQLYQEINIVQFCKQNLTDAFTFFTIEQNLLSQVITDQGLLTNLAQLFNQ